MDDSRCLVKFYEMNKSFCDAALSGMLVDAEFPFKLSATQHSIVMQDMPLAVRNIERNMHARVALLLVGRSGTGKTTIALNRFWLRWKLFRNCGEPSTTADGTGSRWHGVFLTANPVLLSKARATFRRMQRGVSDCEACAADNFVPMSLQPDAVSTATFPLFVSANDWLHMLDNTVVDPTLPKLKVSVVSMPRDRLYVPHHLFFSVFVLTCFMSTCLFGLQADLVEAQKLHRYSKHSEMEICHS